MRQQVDLLSLADLLEIAAGVLPAVHVRDMGLLQSAAARPATTVFGEDAYPSLELKAAALLHSLARNHPLVDGNKRLAWAGLRTMLLLNSVELRYTEDEAYDFVIAVASGAIDDVTELAAWITQHSA